MYKSFKLYGSNPLSDGINFSRLTTLSGSQLATWTCAAWSPTLNILVILGTDNYKLLYSDLIIKLSVEHEKLLAILILANPPVPIIKHSSL